MAITPFVKPPLSINIPQSVDMKQTESQLTPPGLPSAVEQPNEQQQQTNEQTNKTNQQTKNKKKKKTCGTSQVKEHFIVMNLANVLFV